ncbi:GTPase [Phytohabitans sp. ZYX-F-186]|uniref:GTPase n=1 Tax=Phytohabitans maris TaxID=3071409 RepID=A0ABU0ZWH8_9ACTN|nr:GTPase [Phytohabitans sp. ZYX-F-186]MDQ7910312.1 GTPase [Phytohabitans sp. ZYX-F-186]
MSLLSRLRGEERIDADQLAGRVEAIDRFVRAVGGHLPEQRLIAAHTAVERAGTRLALSRDHTVVALAGATGSGKSSLFNGLARLDLSPVGVRRPTTGMAHACVWGNLQGANRLLDWVGVLPRHRFIRESALDADDEAALRGLVLLDLPDFDSVERSHRLEVDRLLGLVDLVVWVVDPQKYADRVVHTRYLQAFRNHKDVTVVVLNQADRLPRDEVDRVLDDLRKLLDADDLEGVPLLATTALHQPAMAELRGLLERTVAERQASLRRLAGDVDTVVDQLSDLVGPAVAEDEVDRETVRELTDALSVAAGVPTVAEATERAYQHRAAKATGWPIVRGWRRLRTDPLRRLHLPEGPVEPGTPVGATSVPDPDSAQRAAVGLAVRSVADRAAKPLPAPWAAAVNTAARSRLRDVPDALDKAVASTNLHMDHSPTWWRAVGWLQWLVTLTALGGLLWLVLGYALRVLGLPPLDYPEVGVVPLPTAMLIGGLLAGLLLGLLVRPLIRQASRRARRRAENRLRAAVTGVAREHVVAPVRTVLHSYAEAREALQSARS